jgi:hypothetical protein
MIPQRVTEMGFDKLSALMNHPSALVQARVIEMMCEYHAITGKPLVPLSDRMLRDLYSTLLSQDVSDRVFRLNTNTLTWKAPQNN